jgi:hypothetical protein
MLGLRIASGRSGPVGVSEAASEDGELTRPNPQIEAPIEKRAQLVVAESRG